MLGHLRIGRQSHWPTKEHSSTLVIRGHLHIIQLNAAAKCEQSDAELRKLQGIFKARAKTDRNNYLSRIADEVEEDLHYNNMRSAFRAI